MSDRIANLHHVGIVVSDLDASSAWYRDHLGFRHQYDFGFPGAQATMIVRGDARVELFKVDGAAPMAAERLDMESNLKFGGINHLALTVDDVDAVVEELRGKGVEIVAGPMAVPNDSGDRFAFIRDNERMLIELLQPAAA